MKYITIILSILLLFSCQKKETDCKKIKGVSPTIIVINLNDFPIKADTTTGIDTIYIDNIYTENSTMPKAGDTLKTGTIVI